MVRIVFEGHEFDAPTQSETEARHFDRFCENQHQHVLCICGHQCFRGELTHEIDIEQMHPANKDNPHCNMVDRRGCHYTAFEKCPRCSRCMFADGQFIQVSKRGR